MRKNLLAAGATALALTLGLGLAQPASALSSSQKKSVAAWSKKSNLAVTTLGADLDTFAADANQVVSANATDYSGLIADAQAVQLDITVVRSKGKIPVAAIQDNWNKALSFTNDAMTSIVTGLAADDGSSVTIGTAEMKKGNLYVDKVKSALPGGRL